MQSHLRDYVKNWLSASFGCSRSSVPGYRRSRSRSTNSSLTPEGRGAVPANDGIRLRPRRPSGGLTLSLDHLIGGRQQSFRDGKAERLGGLEVDDQFELGGLLHRQIGWFVALENAPGIDASLVVLIGKAAAIAHQAAG